MSCKECECEVMRDEIQELNEQLTEYERKFDFQEEEIKNLGFEKKELEEKLAIAEKMVEIVCRKNTIYKGWSKQVLELQAEQELKGINNEN